MIENKYYHKIRINKVNHLQFATPGIKFTKRAKTARIHKKDNLIY